MKFLIVVDMQKDFISGSLANPAAQEIVEPLAEYIKNFDGQIIFTRDTHGDDYLTTYEGKHLPVEHCIEGTDGWEIDERLVNCAWSHTYYILNKPTFGYAYELAKLIKTLSQTVQNVSIEFAGTCTDICVVSNVLGLKEYFPEADIIVHGNLCAGLNKEKHDAALSVMESCQVKVV